MKHPFLGSIVLASTLSLICSCGDDDSPTSAAKNYVVTDAAWLLQGDTDYIIYPNGNVTDAQGKLIGKIEFIPNTFLGTMSDLDGNVIVESLDCGLLPLLAANTQRYAIKSIVYHYKDKENDLIIYPAIDPTVYPNSFVTNAQGDTLGVANTETGVITSMEGTTLITIPDISALPTLNIDDPMAIYISDDKPNSSGSNPYIASSNSIPTLLSSGGVSKSSSSTQPTSSTATPKSSSSTPKQSSSSQPKSSSSNSGGNCPTIKYTNGASGSGFASRYWDCCKPSCSWQGNSGGNPSRQCDRSGKNQNNNYDDGSICEGGGASTCLSQIPFTIDGCSDMAFAFAAVPASNGGQCGHCFELAFTGDGHYSSTNANTRALKGKKLIVMVSNIGSDVNQGQFDVMIPGGGVGMFNGCSQMGWGPQGEQYGGLLSECEKETNYNAVKIVTCLKEKCNNTFGNDSEAKKGCMFLAEWMHAAGNPEHNYKEVECPEVLKQKYK